MLEKLFEAEKLLTWSWLWEGPHEEWTGLYADTKKPHLWRMWRQWGEHRVYLHRFEPCEDVEMFFHPHPWEMAATVWGWYEMTIGERRETEDVVLARTIMASNSSYEMTHRNGWHAIRPCRDQPVHSVMVAGPVIWPEHRIVGNTPARPLTDMERKELFDFFRDIYRPH